MAKNLLYFLASAGGGGIGLFLRIQDCTRRSRHQCTPRWSGSISWEGVGKGSMDGGNMVGVGAGSMVQVAV